VIANFIGDLFARIITGQDRPNTEGQTMELTDGVRVRVVGNSVLLGNWPGREGIARRSADLWALYDERGEYLNAMFRAEELEVIETPQVIEVGDTVEVVKGQYTGRRSRVISVEESGEGYPYQLADLRGVWSAPYLKVVAKGSITASFTTNPGRAEPIYGAVSDEDKRPENVTSDTLSVSNAPFNLLDETLKMQAGLPPPPWPKGGPVTDIERLWEAIDGLRGRLSKVEAVAVEAPQARLDRAAERVSFAAKVFEQQMAFLCPPRVVDFEPPRPGPEVYARVNPTKPVLDWSAPPEPAFREIEDAELRAILLARAEAHRAVLQATARDGELWPDWALSPPDARRLWVVDYVTGLLTPPAS